MGLRSTLTAFFNKNKPIPVDFDVLARAVAPLVPDTLTGPHRAVALKGLQEMRTWLAIGYDLEKHKGPAVRSLDFALCVITGAIAKTPDDAKTVLLDRKDLAVLRACSFQLAGAANMLEQVFAAMDKRPRSIGVTDMQTGMTAYGMDLSNTIPIWCRPDADHKAAACYLRDAHKRLDTWLETTGVGEAPEHALKRYLPYNPEQPNP